MKKILLAILIFVLVLAASIYAYLQYLKPSYNGNLNLPGLKDKVEVMYDNYGIPHIYAQNEEDLFYAFGYVHAQDRLFQMEILRRLADGRLSEIFGEKAIESDKFFRTMSFREHAKMDLDSIYSKNPNSAYVKATKAYVKGVNQYILKGKTPVEFTLAGIPKTPYTIEDMEIIMGYMGYTFVGAFKAEAVCTQVMNKFGKEYYKDIFGSWPDSLYKIPVAKNGPETAIKLAQMANKLTNLNADLAFPPFHGSNGWVISGSKTKSGKPILSNDTHIAFSQPSVWYEAQLDCPTFKIYGNFLAGTALPVLGHNDLGGWGLTMFENDDTDFYREKSNPANPNQLAYKGKWENMTVRTEVIKVKGKPDVTFKVKKSRHGYILNDALDDVKDAKDPIALWWIFNEFPSRNLEVFYNMAQAKNISDAAKAVQPLTSPGLNFMYADVQGNIGWWAAGKLPKRPSHVNPQIILDGASGKDDILGWNEFSKNPQMINPKSGVLYSANNQPANMGNGLVAGYYVPANRAKRIEELIFTDKKDWTEADVRKVINDVKSSSYPELVQNIMATIDEKTLNAQGKTIKNILLKWDGSHQLADIQPTVFYKLLYNIYKFSLEDELGPDVFNAFENSFHLKRNTNVFIKNNTSKWWDNIATKQIETRKMIFEKAFSESIKSLNLQLGNDINKWQWGLVHSIEHKHPLGVLPVIGKFFNVGPIAVNGGRETINNLDFAMDSSGFYKVSYGPALRRIVDFSNPKTAYSVNPTGQSGYFMSNHYQDQAMLFATGGKRPELSNRAEIEKVMIGKTIFTP